MPRLEDVEGIGPQYAKKLRAAGIRGVASLLKAGGTPQGRDKIAKESGLSKKLILEWVNHVDLFRIKGVGGEFAELLEASGVDTVVELSKRKANNLQTQMAATNEKKKLTRRVPNEAMLEDWIKQAKKLPRRVSY
jgi:predicted flap endonuclease-1-like 5' DNA nuclease